MKRPLQLPLAIALALGGTHALALGLGPVHVKSKLNQPLDAEIPVIQGSAREAEGLLVSLANAEDFERVGINRSRLTVPLEFTLVKGANGSMTIKVTSKEAVRDTYLDFLIEANWPNGRLLREYTVLLDPPLMAPASHAATTTAVVAAPHTETLTRQETVRTTTETRITQQPAHVPEKVAPVAPRAVKAIPAGEYGPVAAGETLSGIAREAQAGSGVSVDQMMFALLKNNPNAFYKSNINALKRGAILRVPSADEVKAVASASAAAAQVHAQIEDWRGGRASPTLVADASARTPAASAEKTAKAIAATDKGSSERLELVPPKAGKDSVAVADRPGSSAGNAAATAELKSELARAKESLTTREQETGNLKSQVKELEDLKNKNDRLIGLKNSEIADLQQRLKQLQEKAVAAAIKPASVAPVAAPVAATATPTPMAVKPGAVAKLDKADIWGDTGTPTSKSSPDSKAAPDAKVALDAKATPDSKAALGSKAAPDSSIKAPAPAMPPEPKPAAGTALQTPVPTPSPVGASTTTTTPAPATSVPASSGATITPLAPGPETKPVPIAAPAMKPATTPALSHTAGTHPASATPWYDASWVKPAALGAGLLLLLAALLGMRKRKPDPVLGERGSIADAFGDSPLESGGGFASVEAEEAELHEHLQLDPSNLGLHLELLSLYYAERDVAKFEDAASEMHVQVTDPHEPEWLEAQAMGQELAPNNPLFADAAHFDDADAASATAHSVTAPSAAIVPDTDAVPGHDQGWPHIAPSVGEPARLDSDSNFGFGIEPVSAALAAPGMPTPDAREGDGFNFDDLPPLHEDGAQTVRSAPPIDDEYFASDDATSTKLDLARAYLDMGDPEGARSMLEEVIAEGNETQKLEAQRLIAEIH